LRLYFEAELWQVLAKSTGAVIEPNPSSISIPAIEHNSSSILRLYFEAVAGSSQIHRRGDRTQFQLHFDSGFF
jgi:hypothetical protein